MPERRVLVVDDDQETARAIAVRLRAAGFQVLTAHDGEQALVLAGSDPPDAIVLDVRMPNMDGLTAMAELRKNADTRDTPVVVVSASTGFRREVLARGARYFLAKPYNPITLVSAVRISLDGAPARRKR